MVNIFVGNLSYSVTEDELQAAFAQYGTVDRVSMIRDRATGQPRGFAFVEMADSNEAQNAINAMNGRELNGRAINVNEARPREERGPGGGRGFGGGGRGNGGGGGRGRGGFGGGGGGNRREPRW
jgi:RNA recognition motif-containing protein